MLKVANDPCSWGILEFDLEGEAAGYAQVLDEMQQTGYSGATLGDWGFMPTEPEQLIKELDQRKLAMLSAFVMIDLSNEAAHDAGEAFALKFARLLAAVGGETPYIVLSDDNGKNPVRTQYAGRIRPEHGLSDAQWQTFASGAERIASVVRDETGLRTVFHHHCAGYVETPAEVEMLLSLTDPQLLGLCFDTGHYRFGGGDPLAAIKQYSDRITLVHFKDCRPEVAARSRSEGWDYFKSVQHGVFCELGQGEVDFPAIMNALRDRGYDNWIVVEQDVLPGMGSPKESAQRNRDYLKSIGL